MELGHVRGSFEDGLEFLLTVLPTVLQQFHCGDDVLIGTYDIQM